MPQPSPASPSDPRYRTRQLGVLSQLLAKRNVDPNAAQAVFSVEGANGGIGDGGHAVGPGQFNDAGGVWTGRYPGMSPQQKNARAWSLPGLTELADRVAAVSKGLRGPRAINEIVKRFERPKNIPGEISKALAAYGAGSPSAPQSAAPMRQPMSVGAQPPSAAAPTGNLLGSLISSTNQSMGLGGSRSLASLFASTTTPSRLPGTAPPSLVPAAKSAPMGGSVDSLLSRFGLSDAVTSGYRSPADNQRVGGSPTSLHLSNRARDVNPSDPGFPKLASFVQTHPAAVSEFFYDPLGWYAKNGRIVKGAIGGHSDHAHIGR